MRSKITFGRCLGGVFGGTGMAEFGFSRSGGFRRNARDWRNVKTQREVYAFDRPSSCPKDKRPNVVREKRDTFPLQCLIAAPEAKGWKGLPQLLQSVLGEKHLGRGSRKNRSRDPTS